MSESVHQTRLTDGPSLLELGKISETLLSSIGQLALILFALIFALAGLLWFVVRKRRFKRKQRHQRLRQLHSDQVGTALMIDYVLVSVPVLIFVLLITQIMWLMRETVIVHYAAYSAARSARVHWCPFSQVGAGINATYLILNNKLCTIGEFGGQEIAKKAARYALISASPPWKVPCLGNCRVPESVLRSIAKGSNISAQQNALIRQARYAFDTSNMRLDVTWDKSLNAAAYGINENFNILGVRGAVRSELYYRHYIMKFVGKLIGERRSDGLYYRETKAVVNLL